MSRRLRVRVAEVRRPTAGRTRPRSTCRHRARPRLPLGLCCLFPSPPHRLSFSPPLSFSWPELSLTLTFFLFFLSALSSLYFRACGSCRATCPSSLLWPAFLESIPAPTLYLVVAPLSVLDDCLLVALTPAAIGRSFAPKGGRALHAARTHAVRTRSPRSCCSRRSPGPGAAGPCRYAAATRLDSLGRHFMRSCCPRRSAFFVASWVSGTLRAHRTASPTPTGVGSVQRDRADPLGARLALLTPAWRRARRAGSPSDQSPALRPGEAACLVTPFPRMLPVRYRRSIW